jgi:hypothetical protein
VVTGLGWRTEDNVGLDYGGDPVVLVVDPFPDAALERLAHAIGEAESGGTLTTLLGSVNLPQPEPPGATKWRRVYASLDAEQRRTTPHLLP